MLPNILFEFYNKEIKAKMCSFSTEGNSFYQLEDQLQ